MNKTNNASLILLLFVVVFVSGCITDDAFQGMFGPQQSNVNEESADLITVQNINIIPNPPISADDTFEISFEVKNNDETHSVDNVVVDLYDSGLCEQGEVTRTTRISSGTSKIVQKVGDVNIFNFEVICSDNSKQALFLEDKEDTKKNVCGKDIEYKLINSGAVEKTDSEGNKYNIYVLKLFVNGHEVKFIYASDAYTQDGNKFDAYNCLKSPTEICSKTYDGITYKIVKKITTRKENCIDSTCTLKNGCESYCNRLNTDCMNKCNNYKDEATRNSCINQCNKHKYVVKSSVNANCYWFLGYGESTEKNYEGYEGQCCSCKTTSSVSESSNKNFNNNDNAAGDTYMPLQTELKEWSFTAPSNEQIGNMPANCPIRYKISYHFTAKTQADVTVISPEKLREQQRSGEEESIVSTQNKGIGPLKIDISFGAKQPIKSGDILPVFIRVEDKGTGIYGKIPAGKLKLYVPEGFERVSCSKFDNDYKNNIDISMIKRRSPQIRCSFKAPAVDNIRTYYFKAELEYRYEKDYKIDVDIKPVLAS